MLRLHAKVALALGLSIGASYAYSENSEHPRTKNLDVLQPAIVYYEGLSRFMRSVSVGSSVIFDYKTTLGGLEKNDHYRKLRSEVHQRSAEKMLTLFKINGGVYIKAGQIIASMDHVIPKEYTEIMRVLQDQAPFGPFENVERIFMEEFGVPPSQFYKEFDTLPIAAASLAQVHRARRRDDGREVAVKVQHPGLKEKSEGDILTISFISRIVAAFFPEFELQWLVEEFKRNLPQELNFVLEGHNSERVAANFQNNHKHVYIPKIHWDLTTSRILTMEFIHGCKVNDLDSLELMNININEVAKMLAEVFSKQIFLHGFVHSDPHAGNILVRPASTPYPLFFPWRRKSIPQLVLLDHGLYRELDEDFRLNYAHLWKAIIMRDEWEIEHYSNRMNVPKFHILATMLTSRRHDTLKRGLGNKATTEEMEFIRQVGQERAVEIVDTLARIPRQMLLLLKVNDVLRSVNRDLGAQVNQYPIMARHCAKAIYHANIAQDPRINTVIQNVLMRFQIAWRLWVYLAIHSAQDASASFAERIGSALFSTKSRIGIKIPPNAAS